MMPKNMLKFQIKNKRGWIKIAEAFAAILIVAGVVLIAINQSQGTRDDLSLRIRNDQTIILRDIQLNNTLRNEIINNSITPPVAWDSSSFPVQTKARIIEKTPGYLECEARICSTSDVCVLAGSESKSIYAEPVIIAATNANYNPRQLKLFCWGK